MKSLVSGLRAAFWYAWRGSKVWLAAALISSIVAGLVPAVQVSLLGAVVQSFAAPGQSTRSVALMAVALGVLMGAAIGLNSLRGFIVVRLQRAIVVTATRELLEAISGLSTLDMEDADKRDNLELARATCEETLGSFWENFLTWISQVVTTIGVTVVLFLISPLIGILLLVAASTPILFAPWIFRTWNAAHVSMAPLMRRRVALETFALTPAGFTDARASNYMALIADKVLGLTRGVWRERLRGANVESMSAALSGIMTAAALAGSIVFLTMFPVTAGDVATILGSLATLSVLMSVFFTASALMADLPRLAGLREVASSGVHRSRKSPLAVASGGVRLVLSGVTFQYRSRGTPAVNNLDLSLEPGATYALVGANGAGKSTLVKLILGVYAPDSGSIFLNDEDVTSGGIDARIGRVAYLSQEVPRPALSLREYLAGGRSVGEDALNRALVESGAAGVVAGLEDGLETVVGGEFHDGTQFSGGEWQRFSLARLYLSGAALWILDEPTSALDQQGERDLMEWLRQNREWRTAIVISHREGTIAGADQVIHMEDGGVVEHVSS